MNYLYSIRTLSLSKIINDCHKSKKKKKHSKKTSVVAEVTPKKTAAVVEEEGWDDVELGAKLELKVPKLKDTSPRDSSASDWEDDLPDFPSKLPGSTPIKKLTSKEGLATKKSSSSIEEKKIFRIRRK